MNGPPTVAGLLWSIFYAHYSPIQTLQTILQMILVDFFALGILISTALWALSNRFFTHSSHTHATDQSVEWAYAFDVHVNSFFPLFVNLYLAQLLLSPVITRSAFPCLLVGNTLYLGESGRFLVPDDAPPFGSRSQSSYSSSPNPLTSALLSLFVLAVAFTQYLYVTYLGYNALPFLIRSELLLFPVVVFFCLWVVSLLGFNVAKSVLSMYFR